MRGVRSMTELIRKPDESLYAQFEEQLSDVMDAAMRTGASSCSPSELLPRARIRSESERLPGAGICTVASRPRRVQLQAEG